MTRIHDGPMCFVFGSNEAGIHGAGAARYAFQNQGAIMGRGWGAQGESFAIPTKDRKIKSLPLEVIKGYVEAFLAYAENFPDLRFQVTRIGCGLAGFQDKDIAPMFRGAPANCQFDERWRAFLGEQYAYWGVR